MLASSIMFLLASAALLSQAAPVPKSNFAARDVSATYVGGGNITGLTRRDDQARQRRVVNSEPSIMRRAGGKKTVTFAEPARAREESKLRRVQTFEQIAAGKAAVAAITPQEKEEAERIGQWNAQATKEAEPDDVSVSGELPPGKSLNSKYGKMRRVSTNGKS